MSLIRGDGVLCFSFFRWYVYGLFGGGVGRGCGVLGCVWVWRLGMYT